MKIKSPEGSPFYAALKERVDDYFSNKKKTGNYKLFIKAAFILILATSLYFLPYFVTMGFGMYFLLSALRGRVMALVGFNIGHDAIHKSFSSKAWVNRVFGYSFDLSGVSSYFWDWKHNRIHHIFTNSSEDDDIETGNMMRLAPFQKWHPAHRWQWAYAFILYGFEHLHWVFYGDFRKYSANAIGKKKIPVKISGRDKIIFWTGKSIYILKSILLPMILIGFWKGLIGFLIMEFVCGSCISWVFQLAHIQRKSKFFEPDPTGTIHEEWAVYQVKTTADFATTNPWITHQIGGLNFQTIHHLFADISHVHYKSIQKILIETCDDFKIKYNHYRTMLGAEIDHIIHLWDMSRKPTLVN